MVKIVKMMFVAQKHILESAQRFRAKARPDAFAQCKAGPPM